MKVTWIQLVVVVRPRSIRSIVNEVLPEQPIRQWMQSFSFQLRFLFASRPQLMGRVLGIVYRAFTAQLIKKGGFCRKHAQEPKPRGSLTMLKV